MAPPFPVATLKEEALNLRAYFNSTGKAEWLWVRVQEYLQISSYGGAFLHSNMKALNLDLELLEVPQQQIHYKSKGFQPTEAEPWMDHTLESRALLSMVVTCLKSKPLKAPQKSAALNMFLTLAKVTVAKVHELGSVPSPPFVTMVAPNGSYQMGYLIFSRQGLCEGWQALFGKMPGGHLLWAKLAQGEWRGHKLSSPWEQAKVEDIAAFLLHLAANPKVKMGGQVLWDCIGKGALPNFIFFIAECLETYANFLTKQKLEELPALKTKKGFSRKNSDHVNKFMLLDRVKQERLHRYRVAKTHCNLISQHCRLMKQEAYLTTVLYEQRTSSAFQGMPSRSQWPGTLPTMEEWRPSCGWSTVWRRSWPATCCVSL